jgi:hypothetical protein
MIWKTYMEERLEGKPIEKFAGISTPTEEERYTRSDTGSPHVGRQQRAYPTRAGRLAGGLSGLGPRRRDLDNAVGASAIPSSAGPTTAAPSRISPSRGSATVAPRAASAPPRR